eukprot:TRINITY_DN49195_c0_g2_i1.p1 TRINITY_DN49195_c0_g2~~TRINITY_DN49195_c0_g2_i1.p1  ORF type:complete len:204 (+),score=2.27 TRINITY_DN49195_c0_g2_i1:72-614(+)
MSVYTAMIDAEVNEQGYIVPGLGDAGDRCYGTVQARSGLPECFDDVQRSVAEQAVRRSERLRARGRQVRAQANVDCCHEGMCKKQTTRCVRPQMHRLMFNHQQSRRRKHWCFTPRDSERSNSIVCKRTYAGQRSYHLGSMFVGVEQFAGSLMLYAGVFFIQAQASALGQEPQWPQVFRGY